MKIHCFLTCFALCSAIGYEAMSQIPIIVSFSPANGPIGTSVIITGTNFSNTAANNIVYFGATKAVVTASTPTQISATVPVGASYQHITVTVNGLTAYSTAPFIVTFNSNKIIDASFFADKVDFATGLTPFAVALSDLDGDGKVDLATSDAFGAAVSVFRNTGIAGAITSTSLDPRVDLPTGYGPYGLAIGDMDGDGKQDLVTIYNANTISVFKNTSAAGAFTPSSFGAPVDFLVGYPIALGSVAIGDLDNDGKPDIAVTEQGNRIMVFRNTGTPGVIDANLLASKVEFATAALPMKVAIADLDGDGKSELAVANTNGNSISIYKNTSTLGVIDANSFAPKIDVISGPSGTLGMAIGDLDGDGKPDLAVSNYYSNTISILKNTTTGGTITAGSFATKVDFPTATGPQTIAIGDLNGDGKPDLAVANFSANVTDATANKISVFKNTTTAGPFTSNSFAAKVDFPTGTNPITVVIGDIDGDGKPELVVTNRNSNTVSILRNRDSQTITSFTSITEKKMDDPSFALSATASSGLAASFSTLSDKVTISGSQVSIVKPGSVTITAGQPGNNTFSAAPGLSQTFCINPSKAVIIVNLSDPAMPLLTSSSDTGNQWYLNENLIAEATGKTYTVKDKGVHKVKVTIDGCIGPMSEGETFIVTGDMPHATSGNARVYPNPVHNLLTIQLDGFKENDEVSVMLVDGMGNTITRQIGTGGSSMKVDVGSYSEGIYYVLMTQGGLKQQSRFLKK